MEHIAALLIIVGCSGDLKQCQELPAPTPVYETREECDGALPDSLNAFDGLQFGQVFAQCIAVDPALEDDYAELTWQVYPNGALVAALSVPDDDVLIASNSEGRIQRTNELH